MNIMPSPIQIAGLAGIFVTVANEEGQKIPTFTLKEIAEMRWKIKLGEFNTEHSLPLTAEVDILNGKNSKAGCVIVKFISHQFMESRMSIFPFLIRRKPIKKK